MDDHHPTIKKAVRKSSAPQWTVPLTEEWQRIYSAGYQAGLKAGMGEIGGTGLMALLIGGISGALMMGLAWIVAGVFG